jgi:NAD-dependent dihydropyrimidine dehydrogenase PreA subunit
MVSRQSKEEFHEQTLSVIHAIECKACGRCVVACPKKVLAWAKSSMNAVTRFVVYAGDGCTAAEIAFTPVGTICD